MTIFAFYLIIMAGFGVTSTFQTQVSFFYLPVRNSLVFTANVNIRDVSFLEWDFGDDTPKVQTTNRTVAHYYAVSARYIVTLTVYNQEGRTKSLSKSVQTPMNAVPVANLRITTTNNDTILVDASSSYDPDGTIVSYQWNFGDVDEWVTSTAKMNHTYLRSGSYKVYVRVMDNSGANNTISTGVSVQRPPPLAHFTYLQRSNYSVIFDASSSQIFVEDNATTSYIWSFGDNSTNISTLQSTLTRSYPPRSASYNVTLVVQDSRGYVGIFSQLVIIQTTLYDIEENDNLTVVVRLRPDLLVHVKGFPIIKLAWLWGDNSVSEHPGFKHDFDSNKVRNNTAIHTYKNGGIYNITLLIFNVSLDNNSRVGNKHLVSNTQLVKVNRRPISKWNIVYNINDTIVCDASPVWDPDGLVDSYRWDFNDTTVTKVLKLASTDPTVNHTYQLSGFYNICLSVWDRLQKLDSHCQVIRVNRAPTASFVFTSIVNDTIQFDASASSDLDGRVVSYLWDFDDGQTPLLSNDSVGEYTYRWAGFYNVSLTVIDNMKDNHTVISREIFVNRPPDASFIVGYNHLDRVVLQANITGDQDGWLDSYLWDFGDGNVTPQRNVSSPEHTYRWGGFYVICLTVWDNYNESSSYCERIFVDIPPIASFFVIRTIDDWVLVSAESYGARLGSHDVDGSISSLTWDFGDGSSPVTNTSYAVQSHNYQRCGHYIISLFVTDDDNVTSQVAEQRIFVDIPPTADFEIINTKDDWVFLNASTSLDLDGSIMLYCWDFGETQLNISNKGLECVNTSLHDKYYRFANTYNITLYVIDNCGIRSEAVKWQLVTVNQAPYASFSVIGRQPSGLVTFRSNPRLSKDVDGYLLSYHWDFGDDYSDETTNHNLSNNSLVTHAYTERGFFNVTLNVTDNSNATSAVTVPVYVDINLYPRHPSLNEDSDNYMRVLNITTESADVNFPPLPNIQYWLLGSTQPRTVHFSAEGSYDLDGKITKYLWQMGDGVEYRKATVSHTFERGGPYMIQLTVWDNMHLDTSLSQLIILPYPLRASFNFTQVANTTTILFDASSCLDLNGDNIVQYQWQFGDQATFSTSRPLINRTYKKGGVYVVKMKIKTSSGEEAEVTHNVLVITDDVESSTTFTPEPDESGLLPVHAFILNRATEGYLACTFEQNNASSLGHVTLQSSNQTTSTNTSLFMLVASRFQQPGGYLVKVRASNELFLSYDINTTSLTFTQEPSLPVAFYSYNNYYIIVVGEIENAKLLGSSSDGQQVELVDIETDITDNILWSIIPYKDEHYQWLLLN